MEKRDSFIMYRSFFESIKELPEDSRLEIFTAICEYALDQEERKTKGISKAIFLLIKPQIDANYKKFVNGTKGGRKTSHQGKKDTTNVTENKPNGNQSLTKTEPSFNLNSSNSEPNGNVNDNNNENINSNNNSNSNNRTHAPKIKDRELVFKESVFSLTGEYQDKQKFFDYWSEPNPSNKKMRFEMEKTWEIKRRFDNWLNNKQKFEKNGSNKKDSSRTDDAKMQLLRRAQDAIKQTQ